MKRLGEADLRLELIQMRTGDLLSLLLIRRARLVPRYSQMMKRGRLVVELPSASEMLITSKASSNPACYPMCMCGDDVERAEADETKARMPPRNTITMLVTHCSESSGRLRLQA